MEPWLSAAGNRRSPAEGTVTVGEWLPIGGVGGRLWIRRAPGASSGMTASGSGRPVKTWSANTEAVGVSFAPAGQELQSALALDRPSLGQVPGGQSGLESDAEPIDIGFTLGEPTTQVLGLVLQSGDCGVLGSESARWARWLCCGVGDLHLVGDAGRTHDFSPVRSLRGRCIRRRASFDASRAATTSSGDL